MQKEKKQPAKKRKYEKKNKAHWGSYKGNFHLAGQGKKKTAKKKAATRAIIELPSAIENGELVDIVLYAVDRLGVLDKAKVFARILGTDDVSEQQMWAITKILKD